MATQQATIVYPESDGELMGETDAHVMAIKDTIDVLRDYFRLRSDVLVGGDMMMYYREGDNRAVVSPDTFVVFGVPNYSRRVYKFWEEGVPPTVVFEYTSRSTRRADTHTKVVQYAELGIQEYILFDPLSEYLKPSLQGYQLVQGRYEALPQSADGSLVSPALGLSMHQEGLRLRFVELSSETPLLWYDEVSERARMEAERARMEAAARERAEAMMRAEAAAREQAEAQIAALQAELARLRGEN